MDDVMFSARRSRVTTVTRAGDPPDLDARFRALVQSPLRAGLLRHFFSRPGDTFTVEQLMQAFGRLRLDVENCIHELVDYGLVRTSAGPPVKFTAARPSHAVVAECLDHFLERR